MKRALLPTVCFAVLSTVAFEETVLAAQSETVVSENSLKITKQYVNISDGFLNVRERASTSATVIASIIKGTEVTVFSEANGWSKVKVGGKEGYVSSSYLTSAKPGTTSISTAAPETTTKYVKVSSGSLNMRKNASMSAPIVTSLNKGTPVTVFSDANGWSKVKVDGKVGYVSSSYLMSTKSGETINTPPPALETTMKYVNVNSGSLNLRKSTATSAPIVTSLKKGTSVTVYSEANGWSKVKVDGKEGYVSSNYLTSTKPGANIHSTPMLETTTKYVNVSSGSLNMRKSASMSTTIVTSLNKGTAVTVYSEVNGWSKVKVDGKEGYVSSSYLTSTKPETNTSSTSAHLPDATTKYVNVSSGSLNMRKNASTNAAIIVKLATGKEVNVYSESNGWAKVEAFGQTGYVSSQYLSSTNPSDNNSSPSQKSTKYVNVNTDSNLNFRKTASTSATVLSKLTKGTEVIVYSEANGWAKVTVNGQEGYVSASYLTSIKLGSEKMDEKEQTSESKYVNVSLGSSLNMRKSASANSSIIVKIARGTEITFYSESNGWARVKAYGKMGYVSSQFLSTTKPSAGSDASEDNSSDKKESIDDKKISKYVNVMLDSTLNMRSEASTSVSIITKLSRGTVVTVYSEENDWARITANGQTGYVSSQYLSISEPYNPSASNKSSDKTNENIDISLNELIDIQMAVNPQTDRKYNTYIKEDALILNSSTSGTVKGIGWNVRGGAGTNHWVVGNVSEGDSLQIISKVMGDDGDYWYQVNYDKSWVNASPEDVKRYLDPTNFLSSTVDSLQFLKLSVTANLNSAEVNERILAGKGILQGLANAFITAGETYKVNEIYLLSHALLETGNGTSQLAKGVQVNGKTVYNMYGIGAYDGSAISSGAQYAYNAGWFSPEAAIIGGAKFIAQGYINAGQDTLYKMRWNPSSSVINGYASQQYATDIGWAAKQVKQIHNLYSLIDSYKLVFDIPNYK